MHRKKLCLPCIGRSRDAVGTCPSPIGSQLFFQFYTHTHILRVWSQCPHPLTESPYAMLNGWSRDIQYISLPLCSVHGFEAICYWLVSGRVINSSLNLESRLDQIQGMHDTNFNKTCQIKKRAQYSLSFITTTSFLFKIALLCIAHKFPIRLHSSPLQTGNAFNSQSEGYKFEPRKFLQIFGGSKVLQ